MLICSADDAPFKGRVDVSLSTADASTFRGRSAVLICSAADASSFRGMSAVLICSAADDPLTGKVDVLPSAGDASFRERVDVSLFAADGLGTGNILL